MRPKVSFILVGAFVLLLSAGLMVGLVFLSTSGADDTYKKYLVYVTESVSGLNTNASVSYNGVDVGVVSEIELDLENPERVRVVLSIREEVPVNVDTVAILASSGITGIAHVELSGGTSESPRLVATPCEEYPVIQSAPSLFVRLDQSITGLVAELTDAAASLSNVADRVEGLLTTDNQAAIAHILANVDEFTSELTLIAREVTTTTHNVSTASEALPGLVRSAERTVRDFAGSAAAVEAAGEAMTATAEGLSADFDEMSAGVMRLLNDLTPLTRGAPTQLVHLVDEMQLLTASLRRIAQDVERNPDMLLFGRSNQERGPGE
jgi:phospholipid/cholesterol/gamma-HCH transport system substrate-binding protein